MNDELVRKVAEAIGESEGYVSKPVMRKRFEKAARAALAVFEAEWVAPDRVNLGVQGGG